MDKYDFYDSDKVDAFREARNKKFRGIIKRYSEAKEKCDPAAITKSLEAISRFKEQDKKYEQYAEEAGICWP
jgi:hypothetical protein